MRRCATSRSSGSGAATAAHAERYGVEAERRRARSRRRCARPTSSARRRPRASRSSSATGSRPARTSTRSARASRATRELDAATVAAARALRRPARVDAERGRRLPARRARGDRRGAHRAPSSARCSRGTHPGRTSADELTVFKSLGLARRGPRRGRARRARRRARAGRRHRGRVLIAARRDRARARDDRRRRGAHAARPPAASTSAGRDLAQAREPAADRLVQDPRRRQRDPQAPPAASARRASSRRAPATWRRASPGPRASSACRRRRRPRARAADEARRDRAARRPGRARCRSSDWWRRSRTTPHPTAPTGSSSIPCRTTRVMAGNGTIGLELAGGPARRRRGARAVGRRRAVHRHRERARGAAARTRVVAVRARDGRAADAPRSPRASRARSTTRRRSSTAPAPKASCRRCGSRAQAARRRRRVVSLDETAAAVRLLAERARVIAEGAGALALAAALRGHGRRRQDRLHRLGREHRRRRLAAILRAVRPRSDLGVPLGARHPESRIYGRFGIRSSWSRVATDSPAAARRSGCHPGHAARRRRQPRCMSRRPATTAGWR